MPWRSEHMSSRPKEQLCMQKLHKVRTNQKRTRSTSKTHCSLSLHIQRVVLCKVQGPHELPTAASSTPIPETHQPQAGASLPDDALPSFPAAGAAQHSSQPTTQPNTPPSGYSSASVNTQPFPTHPPHALPQSGQSSLHPSRPSRQNGQRPAAVLSSLAQPVYSALPLRKQSTWSSDEEEAAPADAVDDRLPGFAVSSIPGPTESGNSSFGAAAHGPIQVQQTQQTPAVAGALTGSLSQQSGWPGSVTSADSSVTNSQAIQQRRGQRTAGDTFRQPSQHSSGSSAAMVAALSGTTGSGHTAGADSDADRPPGFTSQRSMQAQAAEPRQAAVQESPSPALSLGWFSTGDHPPGFAQATPSLSSTPQQDRQRSSGLPEGSRQSGLQLKGGSSSTQLKDKPDSAQFSTPGSVPAEAPRPGKPTVLPVPVRSGPYRSQKGRTQAGVALSPAPSASASPQVSAATSASSPPPSAAGLLAPLPHPVEDCPPGFLPPKPHGRAVATAGSRSAQTADPTPHQHTTQSDGLDQPPGFPQANARASLSAAQMPAGPPQSAHAGQTHGNAAQAAARQQQHQQVLSQQAQPQGQSSQQQQRRQPQQQPQPQRQLSGDLRRQSVLPSSAPKNPPRASHPSASTPSTQEALQSGVPAPKSQPSAASLQPPAESEPWYPPVVPLGLMQKIVSVTRLPVTPSTRHRSYQQQATAASGAGDRPPGFAVQSQSHAFASQPRADPAQPRADPAQPRANPPQQHLPVLPPNQQRVVSVTKLSVSPNTGSSRTPMTAPSSSNAAFGKKSTCSQATPQLPSPAGASASPSTDLPPGFPDAQAQPWRLNAYASIAQQAASQMGASSVHVSEPAQASHGGQRSADQLRGVPATDAVVQGSSPGQPALATASTSFKGATKGFGESKGAGAVQKTGGQRSDAKRKASIPKVSRCVQASNSCHSKPSPAVLV